MLLLKAHCRKLQPVTPSERVRISLGAAVQYGATASGRLARRYKRFLADVHLCQDSDAVTVCHCPNTGPMTGLLDRCGSDDDPCAAKMPAQASARAPRPAPFSCVF